MKDEAGMRRENCREGSSDQTAIQQQAQPCQTNSFHETICWPSPGTLCRRASPSWACSTWRGRASRCTPSSWPALPKQTCDTNSKNHCTQSKIQRQLINIKPEPPGPRLSLWLVTGTGGARSGFCTGAGVALSGYCKGTWRALSGWCFLKMLHSKYGSGQSELNEATQLLCNISSPDNNKQKWVSSRSHRRTQANQQSHVRKSVLRNARRPINASTCNAMGTTTQSTLKPMASQLEQATNQATSERDDGRTAFRKRHADFAATTYSLGFGSKRPSSICRKSPNMDERITTLNP